MKPFGPALEEARELEKDARQIEAALRLEKDPALEAMLAKIRQTIEELKQPGLDMRRTMAKLSALDAAIAAQRRELNVAVADRQLQSLGSALAEAKPLEPAGRKLQESRFGQAAEELEKAGDASIPEGEAKTVEQLAGKSAKEMQAQGLEQLGKATETLAEGVKRGGKPLKEGTKGLAKRSATTNGDDGSTSSWRRSRNVSRIARTVARRATSSPKDSGRWPKPRRTSPRRSEIPAKPAPIRQRRRPGARNSHDPGRSDEAPGARRGGPIRKGSREPWRG